MTPGEAAAELADGLLLSSSWRAGSKYEAIGLGTDGSVPDDERTGTAKAAGREYLSGWQISAISPSPESVTVSRIDCDARALEEITSHSLSSPCVSVSSRDNIGVDICSPALPLVS